MSDFTCWSCAHWRPTACALALRLYPHATPRTCERFDYEPGSDEQERHGVRRDERPAQATTDQTKARSTP